MFPFLSAQNYAVLFPDHEGPRMSYAAGKMAGHAVLDSVRGMLSERPDLAESPIVMHGYSGGAIATAWAAQLQPTYARSCGSPARPQGNAHRLRSVVRQHEPRRGRRTFAAATIGQAREFPELVQIFGDFALYCAIRARTCRSLHWPLRVCCDSTWICSRRSPSRSSRSWDNTLSPQTGRALSPRQCLCCSTTARAVRRWAICSSRKRVPQLRDAWRANGADVDYWALPGEHVTADMFAIPWVVNWIRRKLLG